MYTSKHGIHRKAANAERLFWVSILNFVADMLVMYVIVRLQASKYGADLWRALKPSSLILFLTFGWGMVRNTFHRCCCRCCG